MICLCSMLCLCLCNKYGIHYLEEGIFMNFQKSPLESADPEIQVSFPQPFFFFNSFIA